MGISLPTTARFMSVDEYAIVSRVMGATLPYRYRIIITDGAGLDNRPFTIPTSLVTTILGTAAAPFLAPVIALGGYLGSAINLAYLINVGSAYLDMSSSNTELLVHETTHVWQGKNSYLALSYVFDSCISQCIRGSGAYGYTAGSNWYSYNAEQQASIVEDWFVSGEPTSGALWDYIRDYVRQGRD
jgi:hypothetical protein